MNCPKCGKENPDDAHVCRFCNASMTETLESKQPVTVRVSKLATIALLLGILSLLLFSPLPFLARLLDKIGLFLPLLAIILGLISIIQIEQSGGKITGRAYAIAAVLIPIFAGLLSFLFAILYTVRSQPLDMVCGTNLSGIGKAMLIYSNDYDDEFPRAGGRSSVWSSSIPDWTANNRFAAYGLSPDGSGGRATISSSLYLLVKYAEVTPKSFICKNDTGVTEFNPKKHGFKDKDLIDLWDFGPKPTKHYSYSYHMPYGLYALTSSSEPGMAVAADRNPWMKEPAVYPKNFAYFNPDGDIEAIKAGNCNSHKGDGQNVLFLDGHASFEKVSFCGVNDDNIYTYWNEQDIRRGTVPVLGSQPADRLDSMLVNDPAIPRK